MKRTSLPLKALFQKKYRVTMFPKRWKPSRWLKQAVTMVHHRPSLMCCRLVMKFLAIKPGSSCQLIQATTFAPNRSLMAVSQSNLLWRLLQEGMLKSEILQLMLP